MESIVPTLQDLRTDLTSAWLSLALGCAVLSFKWKFLKKSPGCVVLCYSIESNGKLARSMVLKCHDMDEKIRALQVSSLMYDREVYFYRNLAAGMKDLNVPRVYAIGQQTPEFYYVLMENLHEEWQPCRFNPDGAISKETMRLAILDILKMHVKFWKHELVDSSPFFEKEVLRDQLQRILEFKESWKTVRTQFPVMAGWTERESNGYPKSMEKLVQYLDFCALGDNAINYYKKANEILGERPFTLVHGDLNCSNFFFGGRPDNSEKICWIDWGMTRSGPIALDFLTLWSTLSITNEGTFHYNFLSLTDKMSRFLCFANITNYCVANCLTSKLLIRLI